MTVFLIVLACVVWWAVGTISLIWWHTADLDLDWSDLFLYVPVGALLGVIAFFAFIVPMKFEGKFGGTVMVRRKCKT